MRILISIWLCLCAVWIYYFWQNTHDSEVKLKLTIAQAKAVPENIENHNNQAISDLVAVVQDGKIDEKEKSPPTSSKQESQFEQIEEQLNQMPDNALEKIESVIAHASPLKRIKIREKYCELVANSIHDQEKSLTFFLSQFEKISDGTDELDRDYQLFVLINRIKEISDTPEYYKGNLERAYRSTSDEHTKLLIDSEIQKINQ